MVSRKQRPRRHAADHQAQSEFIASREQMIRASTEFLKIDIETALTFLKIARETGDGVRKRRTCLAARKAYDTVNKLLLKVELGVEDQRIVVGGLAQVRSELEQLGEVF